MTTPRLDDDESLALVALVRFLIEANARATDEESEAVRQLSTQLGRDRYRQLALEADERAPDEARLRELLRDVRRQEARERIYATAVGVATADVPLDRAADLLDWLKRTWRVPMRFEPPT